MTAKWWDEIQNIFEDALELPADQRASFVESQAGGDRKLIDEVMSLLQAYEGDTDILSGNAFSILVPEASEVAEEGEIFGPYRILKKVGIGGMGTVYLAERADGSFDQQVAIKVVKKGMDSELVLERFKFERQVLAKLQHPNIARLLDGGVTTDGRPFFVMEYVVGETITAYADRLQLSIGDRLRLFTHVCKAIHHAHKNLVVHRDLKPSNILVNPDGVVKLLDFGIAKVLDETEDPSLTRTGQNVLTPAYASPEQLTSADITTSSDVYSLGVILYELLSGRRPFEVKRSREELRQLVLSTDPDRPSTAILKTGAAEELDADPLSPETVSRSRGTKIEKLKRQLSGDLDKICLMALRKEPERRYTSAEEFASDIKRHLDGLTVYAQPDSVSYRTQKFLARHKVGVGIAGAVFVGFLTLVAFYTNRVENERDIALDEQAKTNEVVKFVTGLFEYADPDNSRGEEITIQEILDEGAEQIRTDLNDRPEIQSTLKRVLGEVYYGIGNIDAADSLLNEALDQQNNQPNISPLELAQTQIALGIIRQDLGDLDVADSLFRESLKIRLDENGPLDADVAESKSALGYLYETNGRYAAAESLYLEVLTANLAVANGAPDNRVAESYQFLAGLYRLSDRSDEAETYLRAALDVQNELFGGDHLEIAETKRHLAAVLRDSDRYVESDSLFKQVLEMRTRMLGPTHPEVGNTWNSYSTLLAKMGDDSGAIAANKKMMDILMVNTSGPSASLAAAYNNRAVLLRDSGDIEGAREHYRKSIEIQDAIGLDARHPNRAFPLIGISGLYEREGNYEAAIRIQRDVLALRREALTSAHRHTMDTASDLAANLTSTGEFDEAEALLTEAFKYFSAKRGIEDWRTQRTVSRLVTLYEQQGRADDAAEYQTLLVQKQ